MNADRIAEMSPAIREVLAEPARPLCATFEVVGRPDAWAQVTAERVNIAYPGDAPPETRLATFLADPPCAGVELVEWVPAQAVTFRYRPDRPQAVARFVEGLLADLFGLGDEAVDVCLDDLR